MIVAGTLPLRKPGTVICCAIFLYAESRLGFSSSKATSTVSLARVGLRVSTALFTGGLLGRTNMQQPVVTGRVSDGQVLLRSGQRGRGDRTRTCGLLLPKQAR